MGRRRRANEYEMHVQKYVPVYVELLVIDDVGLLPYRTVC